MNFHLDDLLMQFPIASTAANSAVANIFEQYNFIQLQNGINFKTILQYQNYCKQQKGSIENLSIKDQKQIDNCIEYLLKRSLDRMINQFSSSEEAPISLVKKEEQKLTRSCKGNQNDGGMSDSLSKSKTLLKLDKSQTLDNTESISQKLSNFCDKQKRIYLAELQKEVLEFVSDFDQQVEQEKKKVLDNWAASNGVSTFEEAREQFKRERERFEHDRLDFQQQVMFALMQQENGAFDKLSKKQRQQLEHNLEMAKENILREATEHQKMLEEAQQQHAEYINRVLEEKIQLQSEVAALRADIFSLKSRMKDICNEVEEEVKADLDSQLNRITHSKEAKQVNENVPLVARDLAHCRIVQQRQQILIKSLENEVREFRRVADGAVQQRDRAVRMLKAKEKRQKQIEGGEESDVEME